MLERRSDPITGRQALIATQRAHRPGALAALDTGAPAAEAPCPFCRGHEDQTPPALWTTPANETWQVRVVPNKFPAATPEGTWQSRGVGGELLDLQPVAATGGHEVIIECPDHATCYTDLTVPHLQAVLAAYQQRIAHWRCDGRAGQVVIFKNLGRAAGASISHMHSQLIALPNVPLAMRGKQVAIARATELNSTCPYCQLIEREAESMERLIYHDREWTILSAFAARVPYEQWLLPTTHAANFDDMSTAMIDSLAVVLHRATTRLEQVLPAAQYNVILFTAAFDRGRNEQYHWHIEIIPRITQLAGFEIGTGEYINPVSPEQAAEILAD